MTTGSIAKGSAAASGNAVARKGAVASGGVSSTTLSRDEVLGLVQQSPPWRALPLAVAALRQAPGDAMLRFLFAAKLASTGLRTAALEQLELLPPAARTSPDVDRLRTAVAGLPDDRVDSYVVRSRMAMRCGHVISDDREWFRMLDGSLLWRVRGRDAGELRGLTQSRADAAKAAKNTMSAEQTFVPALVVSGLDNPWLLYEVWCETKPDSAGYSPRLYVVEPDRQRFDDAMALPEYGEVLRDERVVWCIGDDAIVQLQRELTKRTAYSLPSRVLFAPGCDAGLAQRVGTALEAVHAVQGQQLVELKTQVDFAYAGKDRAYWAQRYETSGGAEPLRVLVLTTRYTTYVKHAAADFAAAFERSGCAVKLLIEPDGHSRLASTEYLRSVRDARPDLIVLINYPRAAMGDALPANVPFVCWIQDAMPHLFDSKVGARQGELDFVVGHLYPELFERFGYDRRRALPSAVVASAQTFQPVASSSASPHVCDVAFVSHQSETPEAMQQRLVREARESGASSIADVFGLLFSDVAGVIEQAGSVSPAFGLRRAVEQRVKDVLGEAREERTFTLIMRTYAAPMADRMLRHQTLRWAADIAAQRGWRLHIYGNGWDRHPHLSAYAKGPVDHDGDLRDVYANARANLHVSINSLVHQRVLECYLSGGLCLCRMHYDALAGTNAAAQRRLLEHEPDMTRPSGTGVDFGYSAELHEAARGLRDLRAKLGYPLPDATVWISDRRAAVMRRERGVSGNELDLSSVVSDMSEVVFSDAAQLAQRLTLAVEHDEWRAGVTAAAQSLIRGGYTHDGLAAKVMAFIAARLRGGDASHH
jgi:hypothetical protein